MSSTSFDSLKPPVSSELDDSLKPPVDGGEVDEAIEADSAIVDDTSLKPPVTN